MTEPTITEELDYDPNKDAEDLNEMYQDEYFQAMDDAAEWMNLYRMGFKIG